MSASESERNAFHASGCDGLVMEVVPGAPLMMDLESGWSPVDAPPSRDSRCNPRMLPRRAVHAWMEVLLMLKAPRFVRNSAE